MSGAVLVAGIGNVWLGDDGFGVEVVRWLAREALPGGVELRDFGIRGFDLAYALERCESAVLIDVTQRGERPGTVYVIEPAARDLAQRFAADPHAMTPDRVLGWSEKLPARLRLVGCEPESFGEDGLGRLGLSDTLAAAVPLAATTVLRVVEELCAHA